MGSSNTSYLVTHLGIYRLLMKGIRDAYVPWPFDKKFIFALLMHVNTCDHTFIHSLGYSLNAQERKLIHEKNTCLFPWNNSGLLVKKNPNEYFKKTSFFIKKNFTPLCGGTCAIITYDQLMYILARAPFFSKFHHTYLW